VSGDRDFYVVNLLVIAIPSPGTANRTWKGRGQITWTI